MGDSPTMSSCWCVGFLVKNLELGRRDLKKFHTILKIAGGVPAGTHAACHWLKKR